MRMEPLPPADPSLICDKWGWENPPSKVIAAAREYAIAWDARTGDFLVNAGVIDRETVEQLMLTKPDTHRILEWLAEKDNRVLGYVDRYLAYRAHVPFYENFEGFTTHEAMSDKDVVSECDQGDFVVQTTDRGIPVLVFGSINSFYIRKSLGHADMEKSAVLRYLKKNQRIEPLFGLSRRDLVAGLLNKAVSDLAIAGTANSEASYVFIGGAAETNSQEETRSLARMLDMAMNNDVTDIDFRPQGDGGLRVLMRQFGDLRPIGSLSLTQEISQRVLQFLMARSGANLMGGRLRTPADGHLSYRSSSSGMAQLRLSFIPLGHPGEIIPQISLSARILSQSHSSISLDSLHLDETIKNDLKYAVRMPKGLILLAGGTNTGKSTTIAGALDEHVQVFGLKRKRLGLEDPIERWVRGITQFQVPGLIPGVIDTEEDRWKVMTRAIKRHDPDVIWLGEVRDEETARAAVTYASSGHLVFTTIHANDAVVACDILARMVPETMVFQLAESMLLSSSQKLVKKLCPHCKKVQPISAEDRGMLQRFASDLGEDNVVIPEIAAFPNAQGCEAEKCVEGYVGLLPVNESLPFTRKSRDAWLRMLENGDPTARPDFVEPRTISLFRAVMKRVASLETDISHAFV